jgi:hypothetical protein
MKTQGWNEFWYLHPADPLIRLAWFVYGCLEREHLLTANAVAAHFAPCGLGWKPPLNTITPCRSGGPGLERRRPFGHRSRTD